MYYNNNLFTFEFELVNSSKIYLYSDLSFSSLSLSSNVNTRAPPGRYIMKYIVLFEQ